MPDPIRAHGAWVYLATSVTAGVLTEVRGGVLPAILAGVGFGGVFLCASSLAVSRGRALRLAVGAPLAAAMAVALAAGADPSFLGFALVAIFPAALSGYFAARQGFHSAPALGFAVTALAVAAPSAACAGGADAARSWLLLALLAPFFGYRTWSIRRRLDQEWSRSRLKRQGFLEALYAVLWTFAAVGFIHLLA